MELKRRPQKPQKEKKSTTEKPGIGKPVKKEVMPKYYVKCYCNAILTNNRNGSHLHTKANDTVVITYCQKEGWVILNKRFMEKKEQ